MTHEVKVVERVALVVHCSDTGHIVAELGIHFLDNFD
jgi:hypothetical protein